MLLSTACREAEVEREREREEAEQMDRSGGGEEEEVWGWGGRNNMDTGQEKGNASGDIWGFSSGRNRPQGDFYHTVTL